MAHRAIWAMVHGIWPAIALDHVDQDRLNNRASNLREAGYALNALNRSMMSRNTSGCTGVEQRPSGSWYAVIRLRKQRVYLGTFYSFEEAVIARQNAQDRLGFSPNHGRAR